MLVYTNGHKFTLGGTSTDMIFDGSRAWVSLSNNTVKGFAFWKYDYDTDSILPYSQSWTVDLSTYFTTGTPTTMLTRDDHIYVFEGSTASGYTGNVIHSFVEINVNTHEVTKHVELPRDAHCVPEYGNFRLWFTSKAPKSDSTSQTLFFWNRLTEQWSSEVTIPGKRQYSQRLINWARDSYIFISGYNESSVLKFNADTGAYISQIVTNRKPTFMTTNGSRQLRVKGYNGMITTVDQTTDGTSNDYTLDVEYFQDDGTYFWSGQPLTRFEYGASTDNIRLMTTVDPNTSPDQAKDYMIQGFNGTINFNKVIQTPDYAGPFTLLLTSDTLYCATALTDSRTLYHTTSRTHYSMIRATGMIAIGPDKYYGETT